MSTENIDEKILKYESFINYVLKEDLRQLDARLELVNAEITDLFQQRQAIKSVTDRNYHPNSFDGQVNIGCNFFMESNVPDTSTLLINIGLNHYIQFSIDEANKYLDARIKAYEGKAEEIRTKSAETKAHIKLMLFGVGEMQNKKT